MTSGKHLVIAAAGTGGHVMPGLAVAAAMRARGWTVSWLGTETGMERRLVERRGIEMDAVDFSGVRGRGLAEAARGAVKLLRAFPASRDILRRRGANAFFSTGGYIAVPSAIAAHRMGIPAVVMNCDAASLLSVRMVLPFIDVLACGFDGEAARRAGARAVVTGNPVRSEIAALPPPEERLAGRGRRLRLLVFGGSLGARFLNRLLPAALALLPPEARPEVIHQCGAGAEEEVRGLYAKAGLKASIRPFIDDMAAAYAWSDLVICRAGATSVSEICSAGVAAMLVPLVVKTTSHQLQNAEYMEKNGAGICLRQNALTPQALAQRLRGADRQELLRMACAARRLSHSDAADRVADIIEARTDLTFKVL
ncbi:undecaprenyldiphospho-muramoylpentapeptide beta-N-acetylglucosaminyltransferase [Mesosutterella sp. OilRF-GAM-744-9]|uniref:UDP-N-acetylglucosamine--N-acetylmuramyl-(pentapeptide) pyrophosphoryl-undecaprenol N-acetylglucosamine transferase n=1 Tax=Mesosutterella porci TaxID=2915351 RepID=A0ABS9MRJ8_9BURK|nr:undecaprenyldiphospho-muramoylpentapeptide beta-N-acetylglucosaminyltransferase [Mesosutterella sp. oilRF-744-WT-GAM-9]MCG5031258.1 undecaprenyldiphospho-muramoylpentapeptide beta-N-acetylglucosaminyltransferase [Mesosutterella sp. oilRF-744-WT-GAM-9]